jgi:site-specific recombinase XerD
VKPTKFAHYLNKYFTVHLPSVGGLTPATIDSYRYAFMMFLSYMDECGTKADFLDIHHLNRDNILGFLDWLQASRHNSVTTRNHRQAAINSFVKFLMYELPDELYEFQQILSIPIKKSPSKEVPYLKTDDLKVLFEQIGKTTVKDARDYGIMTLLYTTGIRVSELIGIKVKNVSFSQPASILVHGKGSKSRYVPLIKPALTAVKKHIELNMLDEPKYIGAWLFVNHRKEKFTRQGINYIVKKYFQMAKLKNPGITIDRFSPHIIRHSAAMGLVESGVDLIYIRDLLGHVSVTTTEIYAKANATKKREAIEAASKVIVPSEDSLWESDGGLKSWLKNFNRKNIM